MAANSTIVLRWEIDNASAVHAAGKAESGVFNEGGFEWTAIAERSHNAKFTLKCAVGHSQSWKCASNVTIRLLRANGTFYEETKYSLFDTNNEFACFDFFVSWAFLTASTYNVHDKVTLEFHIRIISSERGVPISVMESPFAVSNSMSNVILKIGDQKLHLSKEYLAVQSPFFENLFFGNFAEAGKEEVEIKDVVYEEFLILLNVVYLEMEIPDCKFLHILKLADRFQMKRVLMLTQKHLIQWSNFDAVQKLIMADKYRLAELRDHCLDSFSTVTELYEKIKSSPEVDNFSDETKAAIFDRTVKLHR